jgi:hypothetical protein
MRYPGLNIETIPAMKKGTAISIAADSLPLLTMP